MTRKVVDRTNDNIKRRFRVAFDRYLTGKAPSKEVSRLIGCNNLELRHWVMERMRAGMNWNNYAELWTVVHLVPAKFFDLESDDDLKILWNYRNLFPILKEDIGRKEGDLRLSLTILDNYNDGLNPVTMRLANILVDEISKMNKYLYE
jgi:hypothetical protein